jgi:hypothetical protein
MRRVRADGARKETIEVLGPRLLIQVSAAELPVRAQALLDPGSPRPEDSRLQVRRTYLVWIPALWLAALVVVGFASLRATLVAGTDQAGGSERIIYGAMAMICLIFAVVSAHRLLLGIAERSEVQLDRYRQGLHLLGLEGLLVAGRDSHTWIPRALLPAPIDVTATHVKTYAYMLADGDGRVERLECGFSTQSALYLWAEHGLLPQGGGWR